MATALKLPATAPTTRASVMSFVCTTGLLCIGWLLNVAKQKVLNLVLAQILNVFWPNMCAHMCLSVFFFVLMLEWIHFVLKLSTGIVWYCQHALVLCYLFAWLWRIFWFDSIRHPSLHISKVVWSLHCAFFEYSSHIIVFLWQFLINV